MIEQALMPSRTSIDPIANTHSRITARKPSTRVSNDEAWAAVTAHDASYDGQFVYSVDTTGVYCRPSCPSRRPRREHVTFFETLDAAEHAGFRACLRCKPRETK